MADRVLYAIACAAPPAAGVGTLVGLAQAAGWDVCVVTTPYGRRFLDVAALEARTAHPVRYDYKLPAEPDVLPPADAMVVAPATSNTVNKWAAGISDTLALGLVCEALGAGLPLVAVPQTNAAHAAHPAFARSIAALRDWGVTVIYDPADPQPTPFPWAEALAALG